MPFMIPQYERSAYVVETRDGTECLPASLFPNSGAELAPHVVAPYVNGEPTEPAHRSNGWICRLSAPGYMDCTDWSGPYDTLENARLAIVEMYDVDPDTGADLADEEAQS